MTADLLPLLGVQPALGRLFAAEEDREGAEGTLLLSHHVWQTAFGSDPGVLGRKVLLDNEPYVVIGVMPRTFHFPSRDTDIWTAARFGASAFENRDNNYLYVLGRLRPGVSLDRAREEMRVIGERLERAYPVENERTGVTAHLLRDQVSNRARLLPIAEAPSLDPRVLGLAFLLTVVTGLGFGVVPALRACGRVDMDGLREGARSGGGRRERLRSALVVVEVMASVVLLVSSGLLIRALWQLQATDPGFRAEGVLTLRTWLPLPKYDSAT